VQNNEAEGSNFKSFRKIKMCKISKRLNVSLQCKEAYLYGQDHRIQLQGTFPLKWGDYRGKLKWVLSDKTFRDFDEELPGSDELPDTEDEDEVQR
jgi:hypothetical protein